MIFSTIKRYAFLGLGLLVPVLGFLVKIFAGKAKQEKRERKRAEAIADHALNVMEKDVEIDEQADIRLADAVKEIEDTGSSSTFRDPNRLFGRSDKE